MAIRDMATIGVGECHRVTGHHQYGHEYVLMVGIWGMSHDVTNDIMGTNDIIMGPWDYK